MEKKRVEVDKLIKKARASWWEDGIVEIFTGLGLIIIAALQVLISNTRGKSALIFSLSWTIFLFLFILFGQKIVKLIKEKLIWSTKGYAKPAKERTTFKNGKWAIFALLCMFGSVVLYTHPVSSLLISCFVFAIFISIFEYSGLTRFAAIAIVNVIAGIIMLVLGYTVVTGVIINLLVTGSLLFFTGIVTWNRFKKRRIING